jgi:hypothetical protein
MAGCANVRDGCAIKGGCGNLEWGSANVKKRVSFGNNGGYCMCTYFITNKVAGCANVRDGCGITGAGCASVRGCYSNAEGDFFKVRGV